MAVLCSECEYYKTEERGEGVLHRCWALPKPVTRSSAYDAPIACVNFTACYKEIGLKTLRPKTLRSKPLSFSDENGGVDLEALFVEFWNAYPRRPGDSRKNALMRYSSLIEKGVPPEQLLLGAKNYAASRVGEDSKFTAMCQTWLFQERYEGWQVAQKGDDDLADYARRGW